MSLYWLLKCSYLFDSFPVAHCFVTVCLWKVLAYPALADLIVFFTGRLQQSVYMEDVNLSANTHQPAHWANWKQNPFAIITKAAPFETRGLQLLLWRWTSSVCSFTVSHSFAWWLVSECLQTNGILNTNYRWLSAGDQINHEQILGLPPPHQQPDR